MDIGTLTGAIELDDHLSSGLEIAASKVSDFADSFDGMVGTVLKGSIALVGAIATITGSIVALGERGSTILGVENAFDNLAAKIGTTGEKLRSDFSSGLKNTVSSMDIMQSTVRLLSSGMQISSDQATLMGQAARALGKATGTDAKDGLEQMSSALLTGRVKGLQAQIGLIDLAGGEKKYADSIGVTVGQLSVEGQLHGKQLAIFDAARAYIDRMGDSQLSFKERIKQGIVVLEQWGEDLAKSVASSPHVNAALATVAKALQDTFGGEGKEALETITGWIDKFADIVTADAPTIIREMKNVLDGIKSVYDFLASHVTDIKNFAIGVGAYTAAWALLTVGSSLISGVIAGIEAIGTAAAVLEAGSLVSLITPIGAIAAAVGLLTWQILQFESSLNHVKTAGQAIPGLGVSLDGKGAPSGTNLAGSGIRINVGSGSAGAGGSGSGSGKPSDVKGPDENAIAKSIADTEQLWEEYFQYLDKASGNELAAQLNANDRWYDGKVSALDKAKITQDQYNKQLDALNSDYYAKQESTITEFNNKITEKTVEDSRSIASETRSAIDTAFSGMPSILANMSSASAQFNNVMDETGKVIGHSLVSGSLLGSHAIQGLTNDGRLMGQTYTNASEMISQRMHEQFEATQPLSPEVQDLVDRMRSLGFTSAEIASSLGLPFTQIQTGAEKSIQKLEQLGSNLSALSGAFSQLAQIAGHAFGGVVGGIATATGNANVTMQGVLAYNHARTQVNADGTVGNKAGEVAGIASAAAGGLNEIQSISDSSKNYVDSAGEVQGKGAVGSAASGALSGAAFGTMVLPGIGTAVGAIAGAIVGLVGSLSGPSKEELHTRVSRDDFMKDFQSSSDKTGIQTLENQITGIGGSASQAQLAVGRLLDAKTPADFARALAPIQAAITAATNVQHAVTSVTTLGNSFVQNGHVMTQAMVASITEMAKMPGITEAEKKALNDLADSAKPNFDSLESIAEKYGTTLQGLGPRLAQGQITDTAQKIYQDFQDLTNAGADVGSTIGAMHDQLQNLAQQAITSGSSLPEFMRPLLENLQGSLHDTNGDLIDVSKIHFDNTPVTNSLTDMQNSLDTLHTTLSTDIPNALSALVGSIPGNPFAGWTVPGEPTPTGEPPVTASTGGIVPSYYGSGGLVDYSPRGSDTVPAMLTPGEQITDVPDVHTQVASLVKLAAQQDKMITEMRRTNSQLSTMPGTILKGQRYAALVSNA